MAVMVVNCLCSCFTLSCCCCCVPPGSNTHNNGAPGGDGQTGDAGEGRGGQLKIKDKNLVNLIKLTCCILRVSHYHIYFHLALYFTFTLYFHCSFHNKSWGRVFLSNTYRLESPKKCFPCTQQFYLPLNCFKSHFFYFFFCLFVCFFNLGTDRHNIVEIPESNSNYPCLSDKPCDSNNPRMFRNARVVYGHDGQNEISGENLELTMNSGGYYKCINPEAGCTAESVRDKEQMNQLLNNVSPSFEGFVLKLQQGTYRYICSRNNNFTNRSQKGMINVVASN